MDWHCNQEFWQISCHIHTTEVIDTAWLGKWQTWNWSVYYQSLVSDCRSDCHTSQDGTTQRWTWCWKGGVFHKYSPLWYFLTSLFYCAVSCTTATFNVTGFSAGEMLTWDDSTVPFSNQPTASTCFCFLGFLRSTSSQCGHHFQSWGDSGFSAQSTGPWLHTQHWLPVDTAQFPQLRPTPLPRGPQHALQLERVGEAVQKGLHWIISQWWRGCQRLVGHPTNEVMPSGNNHHCHFVNS